MTRLRFFIAQAGLAFLPPFVVLLVAQEEGRNAAELSIVFAVVGAVFSISYCGQRSYIAIRGLQVIDAKTAVRFRSTLSLAACLVTLLLGVCLNLGISLVAFAIGMKLSEGIVDLWAGIQLWATNGRRASWLFVRVSLVRAMLIGVPVLLLGPSAVTQNPVAVLYLVALALIGLVLVHRDLRRRGLLGSRECTIGGLLACGKELRSYMAATASCAILASIPRLILPFADHMQYTAAGLALSIVPVFGLVFQALWLAQLKRLVEDLPRNAPRFVLEVALLVSVVGAGHHLWRWIGGEVYGLVQVQEQAVFSEVLIAGAALFGAIALMNIFKLTVRPRNESFAYVIGSIVTATGVVICGLSVSDGLYLAAAIMLAFLVFVGARGARADLRPGSRVGA